MDPATARVVLKIQLDDVDAILKTLPKSSDDSTISGERAAFKLFREELVNKHNEVYGKFFAYTIVKEENSNHAAFKKLLSDEQQAERDHEMACRLAGMPVPQRPTASNKRVVNGDDADQKAKSVDSSDKPKPDGTLSSPATVCWSDHEEVKDRVAATTEGTCTSCLDMFPKGEMLQLPCKGDGDTEAHAYCRDCLTRLFESCMTDTSHFPPRCCTKIIPLFGCVPFLSHGILSRFVAKREELETPNRNYCSNVDCGIWIRPVHITGGVAKCGACDTKTCVTCKSRQHDGLCPEDKDVKKLLDVAKKQHWKACPDCKEMVELDRGCYHITCRCRYEFCYLCRAKWHTCQCPAWDERNIVDRPLPAQPVANAANVPRVQAQPAPAPAVAPVPAIAAPAPAFVPLAPAFPAPAPPFAAPAAPIPAQAPPLAPYPQFHAQQQPMPVQPPMQHPHANQAPAAYNYYRACGCADCTNQDMARHHLHTFARHYRSQGADTECGFCNEEDRWINVCSGCNVRMCWYCTKHGPP